MVCKGISTTSFSSSIQSFKLESVVDERKWTDIFHTRVITKHMKIDTRFDNGSQVNLISKEIAKKFGLETKRHVKPYPLGWVNEDAKL